MNQVVKKAGRILAIVVAIGLFGVSSPRNVGAAGKPDTINVVVIGDFSGPYAPVVGPIRPGTEDAWQYINSKLGGVHGVKVTPILKDMGGKMDIGQSMYNEVLTLKPKPLFVDVWITPLSAALRQRYVEDGIVGFHSGAPESLYPVGNSYGFYALYPELTAVALKWVKDNWKEKRNPRIGIITWDTGYGKAIINDELQKYLKKIGVDLVGTELFGIKEVDLTAQLLRLKSKSPDFLVTCAIGGGPLAIKKGCREMGWKVPLVNTIGGDWGTIRLAPDLFEGDIIGLSTKSFDETDDPAIKTIMGFFNANKRTINDKGIVYIFGWQDALIAHKVMTQVVDKLGWDGLTTTNIKAELESLKGFEVLGGLSKISYTKDRRTPTQARVYKVSKGKLLPVTPFLEVPDLRPKK
ncbi:MAG: ABC transporter substrate-binding protein [Candidatus Deferrimicrobiaceae bacterium]